MIILIIIAAILLIYYYVKANIVLSLTEKFAAQAKEEQKQFKAEIENLGRQVQELESIIASKDRCIDQLNEDLDLIMDIENSRHVENY